MVNSKYKWIIRHFFNDVDDAISFVEWKKLRTIASDDWDFFATLEKLEWKWIYSIQDKDWKYIWDHVKSFVPTIENVESFNESANYMADLLIEYMETWEMPSLDIKPFKWELLYTEIEINLLSDINTQEYWTPRNIINEDYKIDLPIKWWWGYTIEDAVIIDKNGLM